MKEKKKTTNWKKKKNERIKLKRDEKEIFKKVLREESQPYFHCKDSEDKGKTASAQLKDYVNI